VTRQGLLEQVLQVHDMALDCANFDTFADRPLSHLTEFLGADNSVVLTVERAGSEESEAHARAAVDLDLQELQAYLCRYHRHDPMIQFPQKSDTLNRSSMLGKGRFSRLSDVCPPERLCRTKYYREFLKEAGISDLLSFRMMLEPYPGCSVLVGVGFHRRGNSSWFKSEDLLRARLVAPVLTSSLSRLVLAERVCLLDSAVKSVLRGASSARGVFILDSQFNCHVQIGEEPSENATLIAKLQHACRNLARAGRDSYATVEEFAGENGNFSFRLERIVCGFGEYYVITEAPARQRSRSDNVQPSWRLTPRELEVVNEVCKGARNAEIAATLGISPKTVENHISTIFAKAGVSSRSQLISVLGDPSFLN
jgi:DNA-binding CsgD family transcriptional regulator